MKLQFSIVAIAAALGLAGAAAAEPYVDYTPQKGVWHVMTVKVDPSHIDDYVTGLKKSWRIGEEIAKKHGLIDSYQIMVKLNASDGTGNVLLIEHYPSIAALDADQARDTAQRDEFLAALPKAQGDAMVAGYDKYRTFVGDEYWTEMTYTK
jgi:quinol monooxygenase YgiN